MPAAENPLQIYFLKEIEKCIEGCEAQLQRWTKDFIDDPLKQFRWCGPAIQDAARLYALRIAHNIVRLEKNSDASRVNIAALEKRLKEDVIQQAFQGTPPQSPPMFHITDSAVLSNLAELSNSIRHIANRALHTERSVNQKRGK